VGESQEEEEDPAAIPAASLRVRVSRAAMLRVSCSASQELEMLG